MGKQLEPILIGLTVAVAQLSQVVMALLAQSDLLPANNIFTRVAESFDWNAPDFVGVNLQMDFQTDGSGHFDDDRVGWMIADDTNSSDYIFGVQMDPGGSGYNIEAYWDGDTFGDDGGRTSIVDLPTLTANAWYRLRAEITKLTATSARIDVTLTALGCQRQPRGGGCERIHPGYRSATKHGWQRDPEPGLLHRPHLACLQEL